MNHKNSGAAFTERIKTEVLNSTAINHPYLQAMGCGEFSDINMAFRDFAVQYGLYSSQFIRYLSTVISSCSNPKHQTILQSNLAEEKGNLHDVDLPPNVLASIEGQEHSLLFRRFQQALGVDTKTPIQNAELQPGGLWSQQFLKLCESNEYVGIGAIGIGTEFIVSHIYNQLLAGIKNHTKLTMAEHVFFDLHSECDDEHGAQMLLITEELATNVDVCEQIEYGVSMAIKLRTEFWDSMLERAQSFSGSTTHTIEEAI